MYLCYIDESGTSSIPGNTSHFVLVGISIPIENWKTCDGSIRAIKSKYGLEDSEIHTAWILRSYLEQRKINDFDSMDYKNRVTEVQSMRKTELYRLQRLNNLKHYYQTNKYFREPEKYIHLNQTERTAFIKEVATCISSWSFAHLFAECIDKTYYDPSRTFKTVDEQAFEQLVSRFEQCLRRNRSTIPEYGLLIHDNNQTVAEKHTKLMKKFFQTGTLWTAITNIIETPLFVDSQLTSMIQIADVCGYSIRRYLENDEQELFDLVFQRADTFNGKVVGVRHFTKPGCLCKICRVHK